MAVKSRVIPTRIYMSIQGNMSGIYRTYPYNPQTREIYHSLGTDKDAETTANGYHNAFFWEVPTDDYSQWEYLQKGKGYTNVDEMKTAFSKLGFKRRSYEELHND